MENQITSNLKFRPQASESKGLVDQLYWAVNDAFVMTRRNLTYYRRTPQLLVFSTIQPVMFLLLFTYVFGGAIQTGQINYVTYLLPGMALQIVLFGGSATTVGLAQDLSKGLIDRFRSLPMSRSAVLAGRTVADSIRNMFVVTLLVVVGYIIGFRFQADALHTLAGFALVIAFGHAMSWVFAWIGMLVKDPETAQVASFVWVFPMVFASSVFVPTQTMPKLLRAFAENQPVTIVADAVRGFILDGSSANAPQAIAWILAIWIIFAALAIRQYGRVAE